MSVHFLIFLSVVVGMAIGALIMRWYLYMARKIRTEFEYYNDPVIQAIYPLETSLCHKKYRDKKDKAIKTYFHDLDIDPEKYKS